MTEREEILQEEKQILEEEKSLLKALNSRIGRLTTSMERARIDEYTSMITRPWRYFFINFVAGVFRGLGMAVGFTIVAAIFLYLLVQIMLRMVDLPIIGMYIAEIVQFVNQYLQQGMPGK